jgi:hypothetical protein
LRAAMCTSTTRRVVRSTSVGAYRYDWRLNATET